MGWLDGRSRRRSTEHESTQRKPLTRPLVWSALSVAALAVAGCGSDASDQSAPTIDDELSGQVDSDQLDELAEAQSELTDLYESGDFGSGSGIITIQGVDYSFEAEVCRVDDISFEASGPGQTVDGIPFWVTISHLTQTREMMEVSGLPEASIDIYFGDKESLDLLTLKVEVGKEGLFDRGDNSMPDYALGTFGLSSTDNVQYAVEGQTISGDGSVYDDNGVGLEFNEFAPATFSATCS